MSDKGSVFQKGGGGTNFEQYVQSAFLTTLIVRGNVPCIPSAELIEVAFQTTNKGYETDDLLAVAKSDLGTHRLLAQIKHNLTFSDSDSNLVFKEVISSFWKDFNNTEKFDKQKDRLLIIKSGLTNNERNHVRAIFNWAKTHSSATDYLDEVKRVDAKKKYLDIFHSVVKQANEGNEIAEENLWQFLRCMDLLEYDFLNEGSIDENYLINLIKLSKNNSSTSNEKEIWDSIYAFAAKYNKDGGSVTLESIAKEEVFKHFDISRLAPISQSLQKLKQDSEIILKPFIDTISGFHLNRADIRSNISASVNENVLTIVSGNPGVGKSAIVKEVLGKDFSESSIFVFRADQFNESHLAHTFSKQGIHETLQNIVSYVSLIPEKIVMIDSLEKLLEGDPENAFKQLISLLSDYPDIKVIATSRRYAVDLISQKFGLEPDSYDRIEVPELNDTEVEQIAQKFPQLVPLFKNQRLKSLLRSPKYLDFALKVLDKNSEDLSALSISEFKKKLWSSIVADDTTKKNGLPQKRSKAFLDIAVKRAKKMKLFVEPDDGNTYDAIEALEKDDIIIRKSDENKFSPTHDILEDWALMRYVDNKHDAYSTPKELFENLGNEPAMRRAFRLWVEDALIDDEVKVRNLVNATLTDNSLSRYWKDEVLTAIFKSENSYTFFSTFKSELLRNEEELLFRCILLIRTTCKESSENLTLLPIGSGWKAAMVFTNENIDSLEQHRVSIAMLLLDWHRRLRFSDNIDEEELQVAKSLVLKYLAQIEAGDEYWQQDGLDKVGLNLVSLLFDLAATAKTEITDLIQRSLNAKNSWRNRHVNSLYKGVIKECLSGVGTYTIAKELPDTVISTAWTKWKQVVRELPKDADIIMKSIPRHSFGSCWGISESDYSFSPSGVYKTPIYNLLLYHPLKALRFITEFINYSVNFYNSADCSTPKHDIVEVKIEFNNGTVKKLWGAWELWVAYRGQSVTHYALECILMSLEKYLLETSDRKTETSRDNTQFVFDYLLQNTNNVAVCGVLTSVAIAYPEEVGDKILPLLSAKEFYHWDSSRSLQEGIGTTGFFLRDEEIKFAAKERQRLNQLPHRRQHTRGLCDFILNYQFNIRTHNVAIHRTFDSLKDRLSDDDIVWKKMLTEMDIRNHQVEEYDKEVGGFHIRPVYDQDVLDFVDSGKDYFEGMNTAISYGGRLREAIEGDKEFSFDDWLDCYDYYKDKRERDYTYDRPATAAILGLRDFKQQLNEDQKTWCVKAITEVNTVVIQDTFERSFNRDNSFNLMEKMTSLKATHLIYPETLEGDKNLVLEMVFRFLSGPFPEHEVHDLISYVRDEFFKMFPKEAKQIWVGTIKYAEFVKANRKNYNAPDNDFDKKEQDFVQEIITGSELNLEVEKVNLSSYNATILIRAFIATPYHLDDTVYSSFIIGLLPMIIDDLKKEEGDDVYYPDSRNKDKDRKIEHQDRRRIEKFIAELFISESELAQSVLDQLLEPMIDSKNNLPWTNNYLFDFIRSVLKTTISNLDSVIANSRNESDYQVFVDNFWSTWKHFFQKVRKDNIKLLVSELLLGVDWREAATHWKALEGRKDVYKCMILELGHVYPKDIINVLSTIGEKEFLPEGIRWLVEILEKNPRFITHLVSPAGERLIKRLFHNHIMKIKSNQQLISDYLWLLNTMTDLGSAQAYLFRENVITYKIS